MGDLAEGGFSDLHAYGCAVVFDTEPEFARSMLVENGGQGVQALAKLGEAFLELDGFGFVHFRGEIKSGLTGFGEPRSFRAQARWGE